MEHMMPNREYERTMNHTYLILESCTYFGEEEKRKDYRRRMLLDNQIPGVLTVMHRDGKENRYYYEINSLETLEKLYEEEEICYEQLKKLLLGIIRLFQNLEEYLLEGMQVIMRPDYIYLEPDGLEPHFICYPDYEGDIRQEFVELVDYVLAKLDHTDEKAVMLGYQVYRYTRNPNYVLSEIYHMIKFSGEAVQVEVPENRRYTPEDEKVLASVELSENEDDYGKTVENEPIERKKPSGAVHISILCAIITSLFFIEEYMLGIFGLSGVQMIYSCGVAAVTCMVAAVLYYADKKVVREEGVEAPMTEASMFVEERAAYDAGTVCLTKDMVESYFPQQSYSLVGMVNGEEIKYPLHRFPLTIGKQEGLSDLIVSDNTVSRQHARLEKIEGKIYIADTHSTNGTVKNGRLLNKDELVPLETGDSIMLGNVNLTFCQVT